MDIKNDNHKELSIFLKALTAKNGQQSVSELKKSTSDSAKFFQALYYSKMMSIHESNSNYLLDYDKALQLFQELQNKEPHNSAICFFSTMAQIKNKTSPQYIKETLSECIKDDNYFNKYWEENVKSISDAIDYFPDSYRLLWNRIYNILDYPNFRIWNHLKKNLYEMKPSEYLKLGKLMMEKSIKHGDKPFDLYWSPIEHQIGRQIFNYYKIQSKNEVIPQKYLNHYEDLPYVKKFNSINYRKLWEQIEDPTQPCPISEIAKFQKYYD